MSIRLELTQRACRRMAIYSLALGIAYISVGLLELANAISSWLLPGAGPLIRSPWLPPSDVFGAFSSMVIGAVFSHVRGLWKGKQEDIAFVLVGTVLSGTFGVLYVLVSVADALEALISGRGALGTLSAGLMRPEIWLFLTALPLALASWGHVLKKGAR